MFQTTNQLCNIILQTIKFKQVNTVKHVTNAAGDNDIMRSPSSSIIHNPQAQVI